jgi:hypothetical protein
MAADRGTRYSALFREHHAAVWRYEAEVGDAGPAERLVTERESLTYLPDDRRIIRYKPGDEDRIHYDDGPPFVPPAPPAAAGTPPAVGDPRTVPARLAQGDPAVSALPHGEVGGVAVRRFEVDACRTGPDGEPDGSRFVVSLAAATRPP